MKRSLLDITQKLSRKVYSVKIEPYDLFNNFFVSTLSGDKYKCNQELIFIEFTPLERMYFKLNKKSHPNWMAFFII
mgnify:CR=1 FL=1